METVHALQPVIILLVIGILAIILTRPMRLSPIVGYLIAGVMIGPHGLGVIVENETTRLLAELGVVFLLFDIGVHFSLAHIWDVRHAILGLGTLQVGLCTAGLALLASSFGFAGVFAFIIGATLALSSTAVAVQTLAEQSQQSCPIGVTATAVLVFQDICAIFLLILANSLEVSEGPLASAFADAALKAAVAFVAAVLVGRWLIGPLFKLLSKSKNEEIFTASALLIVLLTAGATGLAGLSLTLGAFLGGMIISETHYRHVIRTEIKPFRGLLLGFFFITVGMSLDWEVLLRAWPQVLLILALLIGMKTIMTFLAAISLGMRARAATQLGFLLSQGSEFTFVIFAMPMLQAVLGHDLTAAVMTAVAASLALTPSLATLGHRVATRLASKELAACQVGMSPAMNLPPPVVIFGMGEVGRRVADGLEAHAIPYTAIEMDHERFIRANADGYPVAYGDVADLRLLETLEIARRPSIVITIIRYEVSQSLTPIVRERYPHLTRFVAVDSEEEKARFEALCMQAVVNRSFPKGLELAAAVLKAHGIGEQKIQDWMRRQQDQALEATGAPTVAMA